MLIFEPLGYGKALQEKLPNIGELTEMLTPDVVGNRLSLVLDDKQINRVILEMLVPAFREARVRARRVTSGHNMRQVASAALQYAMQHDGIWPENLQTLVKAKQLSAKLLVNPARPQRKPGYVYLRPSVPLPKLARSGVATVLLYEAYDKWDGGINVGFADAHVEWVVDEGYFKKLLQEAQSMSVKPDRKGGVK
jgi:prepilin-type processing-associated H-X9-DG protein